MEVVELESLDERTIEQRSGQRIRLFSPAYKGCLTLAFEPKCRFDAFLRPGKMGTYDGAAYTIEEQMLGFFSHALGHVGEAL
jgi:hypothetical protein